MDQQALNTAIAQQIGTLVIENTALKLRVQELEAQLKASFPEVPKG